MPGAVKIKMRRQIFLLSVLLANAAHAEHAFENRDLVAGQKLYAEHCASCHGLNLEGQADWRTPNDDGTLPAPPHDASGHTWHHDSQLLFDYTRLGGAGIAAERGITGFTSAMPAFGDTLSDEAIWNILAYIQSTWPEEVQEIQAARSPGHE